jgi:SAM-dependent methyltransferase
MAHRRDIASLWIGGPLSWLEQLCLTSFAHAGHRVTLYSYDPVENLPEGVEAADAVDILPAEPMLRHARTGSPAIHADMFRLHLLRQTGSIWVDADMLCLRPFDFDTPHVFGWEKEGLVCNAVLGLPPDSEALNGLLEFFEDQYAIAPWLKPWQQAELRRARDAGTPVHMTEQKWGFTGPASLTWFLQKTGEIRHAKAAAAFYPVSFPDRNKMITGRFDIGSQLADETYGVHLWARRLKPRLEEKEGNRPRPGSYLDTLIRKHGVNPLAAPIPRRAPPATADPEAGQIRTRSASARSPNDRSQEQPPPRPAADAQVAPYSGGTTRTGPATRLQGAVGTEIRADALDYGMFDAQDLLNLVLQRSDVLDDVPRSGRIIKAWSSGDAAPLEAVVRDMGTEIARRVVRDIGAEYAALMTALGPPSPRRVADIGCGYGIFDLFVARKDGAGVVLIDIEDNDRRHFGFEDEAAAYSNLRKASDFLIRNGVPQADVETLNPRVDALSRAGSVDLAVSLLACGFHFPVDVYMDFFRDQVAPGGRIVLDLRERRFETQSRSLAELGQVHEISRSGNRRRVMVTKGAVHRDG